MVFLRSGMLSAFIRRAFLAEETALAKIGRQEDA
jgi:hypothetical protein